MEKNKTDVQEKRGETFWKSTLQYISIFPGNGDGNNTKREHKRRTKSINKHTTSSTKIPF